jgi:hypothetical protein
MSFRRQLLPYAEEGDAGAERRRQLDAVEPDRLATQLLYALLVHKGKTLLHENKVEKTRQLTNL